MFSDDNKERIIKATEFGKTVLHWTWIPLIIYVGYQASNPKPSLVKLISPLA